MYLVDTNCFMQLVRNRPEAPHVQAMDRVPRSRLFVTLFTVHSIGVIMSRFGQIAGYVAFIDGLGIGRDFRVLQIDFGELNRVAEACINDRLDFGDGYQYATAELNRLRIVSLDPDFDHTPLGRLTPAAALQLYTDEQAQQRQQP